MVDSASPAPDSSPAAPSVSAAQAIADKRAPQRAALLDGLRQVREGQPAAAEVTPPTPAPPAADGTPGDASPTDAPAPTDEPDVDAPAEPGDAPSTSEPPVEPPGMAQVRKAEQHMRRQLAAERSELLANFERDKSTWQTKLDKADALQKTISDARKDPMAALAALGFTEADFDGLGRLVYAHSPEGQKNPAHKATAHQTLAQREQQTKLDALQSKLDALEQSTQAREQQAQAQAQIDGYLRRVTKAANDETPFVRAALTKNPERTHQRLLEIADRLYVQSGPSHDLRDIPTESEVLRAYEAERIAELEEHGIDAKSFHQRPAANAAPKIAAAPTRPATTLAPSGVSAPTAPKVAGPPSREATLAELAKLRSGTGG